MADPAAALDSPDNVNAFLALIGGMEFSRAATVPPAPSKAIASGEDNQTSPDRKTYTTSGEPVQEDAVNTAKNVPVISPSVEPSPLKGTKAPPPTPANKVLVSPHNPALDLAEEDQASVLTVLADNSKQTLADSKHASPRGLRNYSPASQLKAATFRDEAGLTSGSENAGFSKHLSSLQKDVLTRKMALRAPLGDAGYQAQVLVAQRHKLEQVHIVAKEGKLTREQGIKDEDDVCQPLHDVTNTSRSSAPMQEEPTNEVNDDERPEEESSFLRDTPSGMNRSENTDTRTDKLLAKATSSAPLDAVIGHADKGGHDDAKTQLAQKVAGLDTIKVSSPAVKVTTPSGVDVEGREEQKYFSNWGAPAARDKPRSRVRTISLSGLPPAADLTLVQSLLSGGSLERMSLSGTSNIAQVVFTTGDACDNFFNKYPNGIDFRYKGKTCTVFVDKGKDVDVISGMLQGHLDCGASRVVRATGADEDWSMRALQVRAEGKKLTRKVESILDTYRNDIRTIVFRFASISDAVQFRSSLLRDEDWECCNVQFVADPCEKATGVHLE